MATPLVSLLTALLSAFVGAVLALYGNHRLQSGLGRRLRDAEELKARLYNLLTLAAEYWTSSHRNQTVRRQLESRIIAEKHIVISQFLEMSHHTKKLRIWHQQTDNQRLDLLDAITGGCFQQKTWSPDPQRVVRVARVIQFLIGSLNRRLGHHQKQDSER